MTPERWKQIRAILEPAIEMSAGSRTAFVLRQCGSDTALKAEIDALLSEHEQAAAFEKTPFLEPDILTKVSRVGETIGKYKITDELGTGGMGSVFLAVRSDGSFDQKVALKLIKRGMDSDAILRRFSNERQILASLDHPNIARLIDGGTTDDGLPYFVMEYVCGKTIVDHARSRNLGLNERLDLFRDVCSAVAFAHKNLVIHRDLKPSNILVNDTGSPKLLDFGIAKLLRSDTLSETMTRQAVFTPEYASPEQIRGENLTTATDIYSLGVILYELLAGSRPFAFENKNLGQILETAANQVPSKPSSTDQSAVLPFQRTQLRGDLDNIVLKALRREPEARYSSVEQFAEDIRRHLRGLPVLARQATWFYRAKTFTKRNPVVVGAITLVFLTLIGGITATTVLARRAEFERQKAERRFNDVRAITSSLIFEVNEKIDESPIKARQMLVSRTIEYLDKLSGEAGNDIGLRSELAGSYEKIGDVQAFHYGSGIGDTAGALENHRKALDMRLAIIQSEPNDLKHKIDLASSYLKIADLSKTTGRTSEALDNYQLAVTTIENIRDISPDDPQIKRELARAYGKYGQGILRSGSISKALENYEKAGAIMTEISATDPDPRILHSVSVYRNYAGFARVEMGAIDAALKDFEEALRIDQLIWSSEPDNLENLRNLASGEQWYGYVLRFARRYDESREHLQKTLEIQTRLHDLDRSNVGDLNSLADAYLELGATESAAGRPTAAIDHLSAAISNYQKVAELDRNNLSARHQQSFTRIHLGDALAKKGDVEKAVRAYSTALRETEDLISLDDRDNEFRYDKAILLSRLAKYSPSASLDQARSILRELVNESPERVTWRAELVEVERAIELKQKR
ncbi:MAG: protein kinase [Pyrinomonadaceae bacterium]